jgi:hypothetical protein
MILQSRTDAILMVSAIESSPLQGLARPDPTLKEQSRGLNRAAAQDHLLASAQLDRFISGVDVNTLDAV